MSTIISGSKDPISQIDGNSLLTAGYQNETTPNSNGRVTNMSNPISQKSITTS